MDLRKLTKENLIFLNQDFQTKDEIINFLVTKLYDEGKLKNKDEFHKAVLEREALSETGLEKGLAVPHGKSVFVEEAAFAVVTVKNPISDWKSISKDNEVKYIFLLAIPESESGALHLELLSHLMNKMSDDSYINNLISSTTSQEFFDKLTFEPTKISEEEKNDFSKTILAVTACAAGIAHTYMAANSLVKAGKELGVNVYVEKQGANGIEDRHTANQLKVADAVILATDVTVKEIERYSHLPVYKTRVAEPIKDAKKVINTAIKISENNIKKEYTPITDSFNKNFWDEVKQSTLTGISYIIPVIVASGMIGSFAVLVANMFGLQELYDLENSWLWMFRRLGGNMLGTLMIPILSAYMAYSISDKPALAPGFAAGLAANMVNGGFLAGMLGGLLAGYIVRYIRKVIPSKGALSGFISFWVYPVLSTLLIGILMFFIIGTPISLLNTGLINYLSSLSGSNIIFLGMIIGIMVSFDLGGPVNKAAYTFCIGAMAEGLIVPYAIFASVKMVSAFAVTFATLGFKKYYTQEEQQVGKSTWILGLAGITEGAIPFMMKDPFNVILSLCIGSAVTGALVSYFNIGLNVPGAGIFSLFMLQSPNNGILSGIVWLGAAIIGAVISTFLLALTKSKKINKQKNRA